MSWSNTTRAILDTALAAYSSANGDIPLAWENVDFEPVIGVPWIRGTMVMSPSTRQHLKGNLQANPGFYQVDVFYPLNAGPAAAETTLDGIYDWYRMSDTLVQGSNEVRIRSISKLPSIRDEAWYRVSIQIDFITYST